MGPCPNGTQRGALISGSQFDTRMSQQVELQEQNVQGLECRVGGMKTGFRVWGLGFGVWGLGFKPQVPFPVDFLGIPCIGLAVSVLVPSMAFQDGLKKVLRHVGLGQGSGRPLPQPKVAVKPPENQGLNAAAKLKNTRILGPENDTTRHTLHSSWFSLTLVTDAPLL